MQSTSCFVLPHKSIHFSDDLLCMLHQMTGGVERYVDRGIIPRSISAIFAEVSKRSDYQFSVHISYLEIYNEIGYDLLDPDREIKALEDLPRVSLAHRSCTA